MMEIEIKFGKGRSDRVQVHFDDDPTQLADVRCSLVVLLIHHVTNLLHKNKL